MRISKFSTAAAVFALLVLTCGLSQCFADPVFYSTSDPIGHWYVSTHIYPAGENNVREPGDVNNFSVSSSAFELDFKQALQNTADPNRKDWIANTANGTQASPYNYVGAYTFFVFRQQFDLSGYDASTAVLQFQWAADDSGAMYAQRGSWIPKFSLNGEDFISYPQPYGSNESYAYSNTITLSSGFISGLNTIDFYTEGNGVTDGFALKTVSFTARELPPGNQVPEPASFVLLGSGLGVVGLAGWRRRK